MLLSLCIRSIVILVVFVSANAHAQLYIGAGGNKNTAKDVCSAFESYVSSQIHYSGSCEDEKWGERIFIGYQANALLSFEVGYDDLGRAFTKQYSPSVTDWTTLMRTEAYSMSVVMAHRLDEELLFFGRLGRYQYNADYRYRITSWSEVGVEKTKTIHDQTTGYAIGFKREFDSIKLFAEWGRVMDVGRAGIGNGVRTDIDVMSLGVIYDF